MRGRHCLAAIALFSVPAWGVGDPVMLNVTGNVKAAPCQVRSDSVAKTVDLTAGHSVTASSLYTSGSATPWVAFDLSVEKCPPGTTRVTIVFNGAPDDDNPRDMYKNVGSATPVAIQLQSSEGQPLGDGTLLAGDITGQQYTWKLRARIYSQQGQVMPGTINSVVTVSMIYQ
ncbi:fimbrial protein [Citrobacter rodentium]|jgi:P pilus assembly protein, pilin FimA|uniref:Fimbrial subunit n=2 Tax=Citrobacter rodentium TaxID=67825 RepID=D2TLZ2_CITRI|nr:fimbrial protein [Citrobacter rodentium]KIQ50753.1 fimbrial protein [Citrobacter rodentium]QBY28372.1 type 1 fimbrial protein [Citrobacter rodentium]UHO29754.1 type 1 fimbrial protein [Citrobacter rodentium NBRC 105723 = DSM 16636]CBG88569.1 putative fimbrial subunit [Citrobacter rodentium ICC168]HAT8012708.1 type 1 fimbrial protein [Citrobacter rodentium NBRC 105723 = DSM 16636]